MVTTASEGGPGSLLQAITTANTQTGPTTIDFAIGSGVQTIEIGSELPPITSPIVLDGTTQPGYSGTPLIVLTQIGDTFQTPLDIQADGCTIRGLVINDFPSNILLGSSNNVVEGNFLGTDATGTSSGNGYAINSDVTIYGNNNTIGGTTSAARNVIAGEGVGITIESPPENPSQTSGNNLIQGNYIGTDVTGTTAVGPEYYGIEATVNSYNTTIGGSAAGAGNVISGSVIGAGGLAGYGVYLYGSGNVVQGNKIGTDAAGDAALPNQSGGIDMLYQNNTIGGAAPGAGNLISGNSGPGINIVGGSNSLVQGNFIGTDATGTTALSNFGGGVYDSGDNNTLTDNVIAGNGQFGVQVPGHTGTILQGNKIGTNASGTVALPNTGVGVSIFEGNGNTIGGITPGAGNIISGNEGTGIVLDSADDNLAQGNLIGTDATGTTPLANQGGGILLENLALNNTVGGSASGAGNVIAGISPFDMSQYGILLSSGPTGNIVQGNLVGTNASNALTLGTGLYGVAVLDANDNTIGGTAAGAANVLGNSTDFGLLLGNGASGNVVQGNDVGLGTSGVALPNGLDGIAVVTSANNTIGGTATGAGNVISDNDRFGVFLNAMGTSGNLLQGNLIGTNAAGTAALPNTFDGVAVFNGAADNTIGGNVAGAANVLSGNDRFGVYFNGSGTSGNVVQGNTIGLNLSGAAALANTYDGIAVLNDASDNTLGGTASGAGNILAANGQFGILLNGVSNTLVQGNVIGTNTADASKLGNALDGIAVVAGTNNTLGGTAAGAGNVISGNDRFGVFLNGTGTSGNVLQGNRMGTNAAGTDALPNAFDGVAVFNGAADNTIGGTATGTGNILSGNERFGVYFNGSGTSGNIVQGNLIGVNVGGTALGNTIDGVALFSGAADNTIGGTVSGAGNVIANNGGAGVVIGTNVSDATTVGDSVLDNAIYSNGGVNGLGIDLANDGVTANGAAGPARVGPNNLQNYAMFTPATATLANNSASATINFSSLANSTFRLEFFLNNGIDTAQGRTFLGAVSVTTDANGNLATAAALTSGVTVGTVNTSNNTVGVTLPVPGGTLTGTLTATATVLTVGSGQNGTPGDTSEFSTPATLVVP